jgi:hypothetical protein
MYIQYVLFTEYFWRYVDSTGSSAHGDGDKNMSRCWRESSIFPKIHNVDLPFYQSISITNEPTNTKWNYLSGSPYISKLS